LTFNECINVLSYEYTDENTGAAAIEVADLSKNYNAVQALDRLTLRVRSGEIYGFLGPNGAGKTTTIRILTGVAKPSSGSARVAGADVISDPVAAKSRIGVVGQHVNLDADLTVFECLEMHGILHGMSKKRRRERIAELLPLAGLENRAHDQAKVLSGGLKRRTTIIRALLHEPDILFLDEPTVGLDPAARRGLWDIVRSINKRGVTVFITTHYIEEAEFLCGRVGILDKGGLVEEGEPRQLLEALGEHAVDLATSNGTETHFFKTREEALSFAAGAGQEASVRRTNLEDVFMDKTGKKVSP